MRAVAGGFVTAHIFLDRSALDSGSQYCDLSLDILCPGSNCGICGQQSSIPDHCRHHSADQLPVLAAGPGRYGSDAGTDDGFVLHLVLHIHEKGFLNIGGRRRHKHYYAKYSKYSSNNLAQNFFINRIGKSCC